MQDISEDKFPALFIASDRFSMLSQKKYIQISIANTIILILFSISGSISLDNAEYKKGLYLLSSVLIALSIVMTYLINSQKPDKDWYDGRAIAESVKTQTWRFMMASEPYGTNLTLDESKQMFLNNLQKIKDSRLEFICKLDPDIAAGSSITQDMLNVRRMSLEDRKNFYRINRIVNQKEWYAGKSKLNKSKSRKWFNLIFIAQIAVLTVIIFSGDIFDSPVNFNGIFSTAVSSALAWLQLKRYQETANSYSLASQELARIIDEIDGITKEDSFSVFVSDSENAISREHTMWVARRDG